MAAKSASSMPSHKASCTARSAHRGQGRSLKSTGPPRPASASSRLMITAMAASSLLGLLDPGSSMISIPMWELSLRIELLEYGYPMESGPGISPAEGRSGVPPFCIFFPPGEEVSGGGVLVML